MAEQALLNTVKQFYFTMVRDDDLEHNVLISVFSKLTENTMEITTTE